MGFLDYLATGLGMRISAEKQNSTVKNKERQIDVNLPLEKLTSMSVLLPVTFADIVDLVRTLTKNLPTIVNFNQLNQTQAERGLDFLCGAVCALGGEMQRIGDGLYLYAPHNLKVNVKKQRNKYEN